MGMNSNKRTSMDGRLWMNVGGRNWMEVRWKSEERRTEVIRRMSSNGQRLNGQMTTRQTW